MTLSGRITILTGIRSRGIGDGLNRGISDWLRGLVSVLSISVVDLLADLLGEGQLNVLASRCSQLSDTFLKGLRDLLDLRDGDALLLREILTADSWEGDGLVDTGLDGLGVDNIDSWLHNGQDGDIVASLLGNLLAVVVAIAVVSISWGGLADSHHLGVTFLLERNLNSLGSGGFSLRLIRVGANFIVNFLDALGAHSSGNYVALLSVDDIETGELNWGTCGLEGRGADLSRLNNILNAAIVLGLLIGVVGRGMVDNRGGMVGRGMVDNGGGMVGRGGFVGWSMVDNRGSMVGRGGSVSRGMVDHRGMVDNGGSMVD